MNSREIPKGCFSLRASQQSWCFIMGCSWAAFVSLVMVMPVKSTFPLPHLVGLRWTLILERCYLTGPGSAPGSPLGARSGPPPPRSAVIPRLRDTGHERPRDGRPRVGDRVDRPRWGGPADPWSGALSPARRGGGGGARPAGNGSPGRRHFSLRSRRGLGRGDSGYGERLRLRLRFRRRRWGEAGPRAHHGAGEGADRRGQRTGALAGQKGRQGRAEAGSVPVRVAGGRPGRPLPSQQGRRLRAAVLLTGSLRSGWQTSAFGSASGSPAAPWTTPSRWGRAGEVGTRGSVVWGCRWGSVSRRSASPCAWTGTWTPGIQFREPTILGCSGREPTCDACRPLGRGTMWGRDERPVQAVRGESCCLLSPCHGRAIKPRWTFCIHWLLLAPPPGESDYFFHELFGLLLALPNCPDWDKALYQWVNPCWKGCDKQGKRAKPSQQRSTLAWDSSMDPSIR